jgi:hypothetical protein
MFNNRRDSLFHSPYTWGIVGASILATLLLRPASNRNELKQTSGHSKTNTKTLNALTTPAKNDKPVQIGETATPATNKSQLYSTANIASLTNAASSLTEIVTTYNPTNTTEMFLSSPAMLRSSNSLEKIFAGYTNILLSGGLTAQETNHIIDVAGARANVALLYINPQAADLLTMPHLINGKDGALTIISNAAAELISAAKWLRTNQPTRE